MGSCLCPRRKNGNQNKEKLETTISIDNIEKNNNNISNSILCNNKIVNFYDNPDTTFELNNFVKKNNDINIYTSFKKKKIDTDKKKIDSNYEKKQEEKEIINKKYLNLEKKNRDLEKEKGEIKRKNEEINTKFLNLEKTNRDLEKVKEEIKRKYEDLKKEKEQLNKKYINLEKVKEEIQNKYIILEEKSRVLENGKEKYVNLETINISLEKENKQLKEKYKNLEAKYKEINQKYINLETNKKESNQKYKTFDTKIKGLEKEKEEEKKIYLDSETKIKALEKEKEDTKNKYIDSETKSKEIIEKLRKENEKLKINYSLYEEMNQKYPLLQKEYEDTKKNIINLQNENEDLKKKEIQLQKNNEFLQNQNKDLVNKEILLQRDISDLKNQNQKTTEKNLLFENELKKINEKYLLLKKTPILVGLNNIDATFYMNATLQCLSNTDELTNFFLNKFKYEPNDNNKIISNAYYNVVNNLWDRNNNNKSFSPNEFKEKLSQENPLFAGRAANDSKDLINFLLERLHKELNDIKKENNMKDGNNMSYKIKPNDQLDEQKMINIFTNEFNEKYKSIISNLFYGLLESKSQCQQCKYIKYNFQVYSFIEFPLERVNQYCFMTGKRNNYNMNNNKNPDINLYECFEYYNNLELMTGDNQMYCNICNSNCDFLYGSLLYSTPNYLVINLNRGRGGVYECNVNFPEQLNLFNFVIFKNGKTVYELYAVICHIGPSSMSGHFIAFCKNRIDKKWYKYNDSFVTLCQNSKEYLSGMPYILFYKVLLGS